MTCVCARKLLTCVCGKGRGRRSRGAAHVGEKKKKKQKQGRGQNKDFHNTVLRLRKCVYARACVRASRTGHRVTRPERRYANKRRAPTSSTHPRVQCFFRLHHCVMRNSWANTTARLGASAKEHKRHLYCFIHNGTRHESMADRGKNGHTIELTMRVCVCYSLLVNVTYPVFFQPPSFSNAQLVRDTRRTH